MSWLFKKKADPAAAAAASEPTERIATVAQELPILSPQDELIHYNPFDVTQRRKDEAICPQFAAERAAYLKAKASGQPLVPAKCIAAATLVPEPETPVTQDEDTPAENWSDDSPAAPSTTESAEPSANDEELAKQLAEEKAKVDEMVAKLGLFYPEESEDKNNQQRYKMQLDMLRFLRARKFKVEDAIAMYKGAEEVFDKEGLRTMLDTADPLVKCFQTITPHRNHGVDYYGNPCYFERTGMVVVGELLKHMSEDEIARRHLRYMFYSLDRMAVSAIKYGKNVGKVVMVHDLAHLKFSVETAGVRIFKKTTTYDQNYFPERLHKAFIINAPMSFRGVWAMVKPLLDAKTQEKIVILGANYKEALLEAIPASQLPAHYGGLCQCTYDNDEKDFCLPHKVRKVTDPVEEHNPEWPLIIPRSEAQMEEAKMILAKAAAATHTPAEE